MTLNEQIEEMGQIVIRDLTLLALLAGLIGAASGWISIFMGHDEVIAASLSSKFHLVLFILLPFAFYQIERIQLQPNTADTLDNPSLSAVAQMFTAALGGIAGNLMFFLLAIYIPVTFGNMEWLLLQQELSLGISWLQMGALVIVMILTTYILPEKG
jgi:hypothetical protein